MTAAGIALVLLPAALFAYAYFAYPLLLRLLAADSRAPSLQRGRGAVEADEPFDWPAVSISLPAYNEEARLADTLDALLALDYPKDRLEIVIVSDASSDATDEIAASYADRGVRLLRLPERGGKVAAENFAAPRLSHPIVVNTDATIRIPPEALKPLIRAFEDPTVGVASGRDISVASVQDEANQAESGYVGYEMRVRALETHAGNGRSVGVADMVAAARSGRAHRASGELAYHVLDIMHALHDASASGTHVELASTCERPEPLPAGLAEGEVPE